MDPFKAARAGFTPWLLRTRTQDPGRAPFKRYGSAFRHHRCTKVINSKVITYSFSATELLTLFYRLVRGDI